MIHAAIDGIKNKLSLQPSVEENLFDNRTASRLGLKTLPQSLEEAKEVAANSMFVKAVTGDFNL